MKSKKIDFKAIADFALGRAESLVSDWLPNGKREGHEWRCGNLHGDFGSSLSINLASGVWCDFSGGEKGGDLVSLYAAIFTNNDQGRAAKELSGQFGMSSAETAPSQRVAAPGPSVKASKRTPWLPVLPVPDGVSVPPVAHPVRGKPESSWQYRNQAGQLLGAVYRFLTSDGGKEVLPCVWARHEVSGKGEWRWLSFPDPRPLYGLDRIETNKPILIVEGEKCADAAQAEVGQWLSVLTWPGGGKAVKKADFSAVAGHKVMVWADCDSKRTVPSDPDSPLLPEEKQPGVKAANEIVEICRALGCQVRQISIPAPGEKPAGWDVADLIVEGIKGRALFDWIRARVAEPVAVMTAESTYTPDPADANGRRYWRQQLVRRPRGGFEDCKENVTLLMENHPEFMGLVAYNEFSGRIEKTRNPPWTSSSVEFKPSEWSVHDDREMSMWMVKQCDMLIRSTSTIAEGVELVANRNRFHPVRAWLNTLEWDGCDRNEYWLHELLGVEDNEYSRLVGKLWLRQAVNRIMHPGAKGDYVLILEGKQGLMKSTALKRLGGEWSSDAPLDLNSKDAFMAINGVWIHEIAELDAFNRAESTRIKSFITMTEDRYRPPYGTKYITQPRQTVFAGTTNGYEYHKDPTGNRRFWSVLCTNINLEQISAWREQLFAQAMHDVRAGLACYPTRDQERTLIAPQQEQREIVDVWHQPITKWLNDILQRDADSFSTFDILCGAIKMAPDKMDGQRSAATRVGSVMAKLGWVKRRGTKASERVWLYMRPDSERISYSASQSSGEGNDDPLPF